MDIFFRLLFGHFLADFTFQTNFIAEWKRRSLYGLLAHVAIHPICYLFLTWPYLSQVWVTLFGIQLTGIVCLALITLLHFVEDLVRVNLVRRSWPDNTLFYLWDQGVHIVVLWFLTPTATQRVSSPYFILGVLFVLVTHCATVTIWFIEKDIYGREYPETEEKYISILQRLVLWLAFFLPHPWWLFVLLFIMFTFARHVWMRRIDFSWTSVVLGNLIAVACGLFSRFQLHFHF